MISVKKSIVINAPVQRVFEYLNDPLTTLEYWPSMVDIRDVQKLPNGGNKFRWTYKMAGMRMEGSSEDVEVVPNQKMVTASTGGVDSTVTWELEASAGSTRLDGTFDYTIPLPLIGRLAEAVIVKLNEQEVQTIMANLKVRLEG